jgi:phosphoglycolate phosphatase
MPQGMTKPTIVFDLDGTLAHTAPDILGTLDHILTREGLPKLSHSEAIGLAGAGARALLKRAFAVSNMPLPETRLEALFEDYLAHYETRIAERSHLFPGAETALRTLAKDGHRLAVCTNKTERLAIILLEKLGVAHHFKAICGRDSFPFQKPDARHLTSTIEKAGGLINHAVMIGDTRTDIDTARNAKLPVIGVRFGYSDTPIDALAPDLLIDHFDALHAAVGTLSFTVAR